MLAYKNSAVVNKRFKEGRGSLFVDFVFADGVDWFSLLVNCNSVFYAT